jgi:hypothetical protein
MIKSDIAIVLSLCLAACGAPATTLRVPDAPAKLEVPDGNKLAVEMDASGVQIYVCQPKKDDPAKFEWTLKAPEAQLTGAGGRSRGHHFAGPTWESSDGSKVIGKLEQKVDAPGVNDIPWLLLSAKSTEGTGEFGHVTYIQRLATRGGKAPTSDCDAAHVGQEVRVEYKAKYYFYVPGS